MRYKIPPDTNEREKLIGGFLDFSQLVWAIIGIVLGALVFIVSFPIFGTQGAVFLTLFPIVAGGVFVFYKKNGLPLFTYLRYKWKHNQKTHYLPNIRTEREFVVDNSLDDDELFVK